MGTEQETLIYIEDQDKLDASVAANAFAHKDVKNRAYINTLGAELALKYLASEDIDVSNIYNIHSIKKILEEMDISDIMLPNIHIDVRVVFDENVIFVPKSHFEYNLVPDIYLVFYLAKDLSHVKFLGFFDPKLINKNNSNDKYYFIEKEKLSSAKDLKKYIETHQSTTNETLSEEDYSNSERIIVAMSDNDISEDDKKYLINQLTKSAELRDKFIEYENFETLSYKAMTDSEIKKPEIKDITETAPVDTNITEISDIVTEEEPTDVSENLEIDDIELEPIAPIEDIALDENFNTDTTDVANTTEAPKNIDEKSSNATDIAGTAIAGAAAGAIAGAAAGTAAIAAGEIAGLASTAAEIGAIAETGMNITDKGLDIAKDLISEKSEEKISLENVEVPDIEDTALPQEDVTTNSISLDEVDTSAIDNISLPEENIETEQISLDNVEIPEPTAGEDFINQIDNKISFDDVETDVTENTTEPLNIDEEKISLNEVDTTSIEPLENLNDQVDINENSISLDDVNISDVETLNPKDDFQEETISFDNVDIDTTNIPEENLNIDTNATENKISFNDVQEKESEIKDANLNTTETTSFDNVPQAEVEELDTSDFMDDVVSLDDMDLNLEETGLNETTELTNNVEPLDISETVEPENSTENSEPVAETEENKEGFGKNLLENLTPENLDNISIEDLGLDDKNLPETNAEDISSNDLLSQIDDILNSSATSDTPVEVPQTETTDTNASLDEIPDITDLANTPVTSDETNTEEPTITEENSEEESNADDAMFADIDDLLGGEIDSEEKSTETQDTPENIEDNKNIGVLFNDTDPVTDAELDNIEEDAQPQSIPGAALMNKPKTNKNTIIVAAALVTVLAAASAVMILKPKDDNATDVVEPIATTQTPSDNVPTAPTDTENILANTPDIKKDANNIQKAQPQELKNTAVKPKQGAKESYMDVSKLVWDVPDSLSYSTKMQNYLRTAGKSIKLSLSADLLLADEYAYTNQVKVSLKLSKDGAVQDARIVSSSGSTQIDNIVLQSVKETLNVVKPPSDEVKTPDFNLALIIYF